MTTILIVCAIAYGLWIIICLAVELGRAQKTKTPTSSKTDHLPEDIMGKSLFSQSHSQPQATTTAQRANVELKDNTFVPEVEKRSAAQIPNEELDKAFADVAEFDVKEEPLEWVDKPPINYQDEEKEFSNDAAYDGHHASGIMYEQIDSAVCVAQKVDPTPRETKSAVEVFAKLEGSDLYDKLMMNAPMLEQQIKAMLDTSLGDQLPAVDDDITNFDIKDFM